MPENFPVTVYAFPIEYGEVGFMTDISKGYGGTEYRDSIVSVARRTFGIPFEMLSLANIKLIWDFYVARKGALEAFNLTVKDENGANTVYLVRFEKDGLTYQWFVASLYNGGMLKFIEAPV